MKIKTRAFTLLELMIVVAIIGILVSIAIPSYKSYTKRAHFTEIVQSVAPYKIGVTECYQVTGDLTDCNAGEHGIPAAITDGPGLIDNLSVSAGVITVTPRNNYSITAEDTYILTPSESNDTLVWAKSGGAISAGLAS